MHGPIQRINVSIKKFTKHVEDQQSERSGYAWAMSDMLSTSRRIRYGWKMPLLPQPIIDAGIRDDAFPLLLENGLQTLEAYPVRGTPSESDAQWREDRSFEEDLRYNKDYPTFKVISGKVYDVLNNPQEAERLISRLFSKPKPFPIVVSVRMVDLAISNVAKEAYVKSKPYHHDIDEDEYVERLDKEPSHAMLIVGINNLGHLKPEDRYVIVKNSWAVNEVIKDFLR